jgi:fumarate reductase subunit C
MLHRIKKLSAIKQLLFTLLISLSVISVWRGTSGLMDIYLFRNNPVLSYSLSLIFGLIVLYLTHYWTKELA